MNAWWILIRERFSPKAYLPMILVFTAANALVAQSGSDFDIKTHSLRFSAILIMMISFFFRMRLFDEIKDYDVDLKVNPSRPLARGILKIPQVKKGIAALIVLEVALASLLGQHALYVHVFAIFYSLLMYEEFFIGEKIRPYLTTYAVSHTFVSFLMAVSIASSLTDLPVSFLSPSQWLLLLTNWFFFNLFEFARKTFAPEEERFGVDTYSSLFKPWGALLLTWSQVLLAFVIYFQTMPSQMISMAIAAALYVGASLNYVLKTTPSSAKFFRNVSGLYLIVHYVLWAAALWP